ncbi:hypothetical protein O6H91_19G031100 [Diphasiastrum complanatum]|uniref:Uncharacterized protein n=1 Tax=Diphasiastrum complanatum TaxID=34168 RepID=A0ACC2ATS8_DIPCM|nr:hypothetical protein O6H91_19G031100 [Diphasiastrum complanatum]
MDSRATLLEALQALYHHPDPEIRLTANRWLENFQQTVDAWQVSDNLLHDSSCSLEVHYFCAQTLRTKIQRDFEDLPPGAALSLRSSLMGLLVKFCQGPAAVRTQLCLAIAALTMHMGSDEWGNNGVLQWLGSELGSRPDAVLALLELLTVLPQEANSWKVAVRPERRRQFQVALMSSIQDAFNLLVSCLRSGSALLHEQVLRAFAAWLRLSSGIPAATLATHPLVLAALSGLDSEQTFDSAVDAVAELIRYTVCGTSIDLVAQMPLVQVLVPRVMALRPRFTAAIREAMSLKHAEDGTEAEILDVDEETTKGMAYLFSEMGESYVELIATGSSEAMIIVEALTEVTSHPDYDIARMTFNFWHHLSRNLTNRAYYLSFGNEAAINAERERRSAVFKPSFELLVSLVSFRVMYPPEFEIWRKDELADFKQTRYSVADVLLDVTEVLGGQATLDLLSRSLFSIANSDENKLTSEWRGVEASLYCIRAIAKAVPLAENAIMPKVMTLLPQLPTQPQLLYTSSLTIAAFADWLRASPNSRSLLPLLLQLLINALSAPEDPSAAAALALKHVCDACRLQLGDSIEALLRVYQQVLNGEDKFKLSSDDELQLVEGLSIVVSALPPDRLPQALDALCLPVLTPLQQLVTAAQQASSEQQFSARQYTILIDRVANIFRYVSTPEPLAAVFQQMWPLLKTVFTQRGADARSMERLCRACKYVVRLAIFLLD